MQKKMMDFKLLKSDVSSYIYTTEYTVCISPAYIQQINYSSYHDNT